MQLTLEPGGQRQVAQAAVKHGLQSAGPLGRMPRNGNPNLMLAGDA